MFEEMKTFEDRKKELIAEGKKPELLLMKN